MTQTLRLWRILQDSFWRKWRHLQYVGQESHVVELHLDVVESQIQGNVGGLKDSVFIDGETTESLRVDINQCNVEITRGRRQPRAHPVTAEHPQARERDRYPNLNHNDSIRILCYYFFWIILGLFSISESKHDRKYSLIFFILRTFNPNIRLETKSCRIS